MAAFQAWRHGSVGFDWEQNQQVVRRPSWASTYRLTRLATQIFALPVHWRACQDSSTPAPPDPPLYHWFLAHLQYRPSSPCIAILLLIFGTGKAKCWNLHPKIATSGLDGAPVTVALLHQQFACPALGLIPIQFLLRRTPPPGWHLLSQLCRPCTVQTHFLPTCPFSYPGP